jgi:acetylornithine deacetylase/succinyl-diaminopimelate desuccinylase-like protein
MIRAAEILRDLIAIPSVNPDGDPGTTHTGEAQCAAWVAGFLERLGAKVSLEEVLPHRPNVIGRFPSSGAGKPRVVLAPHTDTVGVGGMIIDPFCGDIREGRVWGRGASDTKGTMAAMLAALEQLGPDISRLGAEITFAGLMGEESAQYGSQHFAKHHPEHDFALVGEPTECRAVNTHKGCAWLEVVVRGKAAHGATPELGENAVTKMCRLVQMLDEEFRRRLGDASRAHPVLGRSTLNIGMLRGGTRANIVPDECRATLDVRATPALHRFGVENLLRGFLADIGWDEDVEVRVIGACAPLDTDPENPFVRKLAAAGGGLATAPWFCDAAWLALGGIPSAAAGPGSIAQAHTCDEWILLDALAEGVAFYRRFLESL